MTQASTNLAFKVGTSAEQHEGVWLGTYTDVLGRTAVVTEVYPTSEQAHAAADKFLSPGDEVSDQCYKWTQHPKYPGRWAVYRSRRTGLELVCESR